jgi:hypothetical protein
MKTQSISPNKSSTHKHTYINMKGSIFVRLAMLLALWSAALVSAKTCGQGSAGKAVKGKRFMSKSFKYSDPSKPSFDWSYCRDWCSQKNSCRAWEYKSNADGGRCDLHKRGYKFVKYTGNSSTYAGRCWM